MGNPEERHLDPLELDAARAGEAFPAHLESCAGCRAAIESLRDVARRLAPPRIEVPAAVRARILGRPKGTLRFRIPLAAAAALMLAVLLSWPSPRRLDIVDAYRLALHLKAGERDRAWDMNHDGVVDQNDVDAIARQAVSLGDGDGR